MRKKFILIICVVLAILTIGAVSASDVMSDDNRTMENAQEDIIKESCDDEVSSEQNEDIVGLKAEDFEVNVTEEVDLAEKDAKIAEISYPAGGEGYVGIDLKRGEDVYYGLKYLDSTGGKITFTTSNVKDITRGTFNYEVYYFNSTNSITLKESTIHFSKTLSSEDFKFCTSDFIAAQTIDVVNLWNYPTTGVLYVYVDDEKRYEQTISSVSKRSNITAEDLEITVDGVYHIWVEFKTDDGDMISIVDFDMQLDSQDSYVCVLGEVDLTNSRNYVVIVEDVDYLVGTIDVMVDGKVTYTKKLTASDKKYEWKIYPSDLKITSAGEHTVAAYFLKDDTEMHNDTARVSFIYLPNVYMPSYMSVGENEALYITGMKDMTGKVTLYYGKYVDGDDDEDYIVKNGVFATADIVDGSAKISLKSLKKGDHTFLLSYTFGNYEYEDDGIDDYRYIEVEDNSKGFTSSLSASQITVGKDVTVKVNYKGSANKYVQIYVDGKLFKNVKFKNGAVSEVIKNLTVGKHAISIKYNDFEPYNGLFYSHTLTVKVNPVPKVKLVLKKVSVKKSAKKLILKATLKIDGKAVKGKVIKFKFNKKTYKAKTNKKGVAKVIIKKKVLKKLKKGKKIAYTASYGKVTVKKTVRVKK